MELSVCVTDEEYEAWRAVRLAVVPEERCLTVEEMREQDSSDRLLLLAVKDGVVVGSGIADRSDTAGAGFVAPRVVPGHRRMGAGSALLRVLAEHCSGLGLSTVVAGVDDEGALAFAERYGFVEVDREVEQVRAVGDEPAPTGLPTGVEVVEASRRPDLWAACFETFGKEVLADFALYSPLQISAAQWNTSWYGDPMFLALYDDEVIGCAGLNRDTDRPERAENALTAVRRTWRGRGIASHLKRRTLHWAARTGWRRSTPGHKSATRRCGASTNTSATSPPGTASPSHGPFRSPPDRDELIDRSVDSTREAGPSRANVPPCRGR